MLTIRLRLGRRPTRAVLTSPRDSPPCPSTSSLRHSSHKQVVDKKLGGGRLADPPVGSGYKHFSTSLRVVSTELSRHLSFPWIGSVVRCQFSSLQKKQPKTPLLGTFKGLDADGKPYIRCLQSWFCFCALL